MNKNIVRKKLLEEKEKRQNTLIETRLVESRLKIIVESKSKFKSLSESQQKKVFIQVLQEINTLDEQGLINEEFSFKDILGKLFGQGWSALGQSIVEPAIRSILGWFGIKGYFANFVATFIASDPRRLAKVFSDCRETTKLIAEALSDAMFKTLMDTKGMEGFGYDLLRNALGGVIKDEPFIEGITKSMADGVCKVMGQFSEKAGDVLTKVKGEPAVAS